MSGEKPVAGYVTNKNHYRMMGFMFLAFVGFSFITYYLGVSKGEDSIELQVYEVEVINQKKVYENDSEVDGSMPNPHDLKDWAEWMLDQL